MAGIVFPVIIHWWNNKQGKVLRIGSVALLERTARRQARSNRLSEWGLLLLRCLLLLLLALLLAAPFWRISSKGEKTKGWILGVKAITQGQAYKTLTDSLLKVGYEWHEWKDRDYWNLFRAADQEAPVALPFYIFTGRRQANFTGKRPVSGRIVHWFTTTPSTDSVNHWIGRAWLSSPDSIRVLTGSSRQTGNVYRYQMLPAKAGTFKPLAASDVSPASKDSDGSQETYQVRLSRGRLSVALDSHLPVIVDTAPLRVLIYTDPAYTNDSRYVAGAIHALQEFTRQNVRVDVIGSFSNLAPQPLPGKGWNTASRSDWIFWLSSAALPANLSAHTIVRYEPGREVPVDTWMQDVPGVMVGRRVEADPEGISPYTTIWKDGFGRPLLALETRSGKRIFHYLSHFDPAWNGLVWSPRFPLLLQDLLAAPADGTGIAATYSFPGKDPGQGTSADDPDLRVLDPEQIAPQKSLPDGHSPEETRTVVHAIDLTPVCWILILLVFVAERILSFRSPKIKIDG